MAMQGQKTTHKGPRDSQVDGWMVAAGAGVAAGGRRGGRRGRSGHRRGAPRESLEKA